jgi:hypothetical protein
MLATPLAFVGGRAPVVMRSGNVFKYVHSQQRCADMGKLRRRLEELLPCELMSCVAVPDVLINGELTVHVSPYIGDALMDAAPSIGDWCAMFDTGLRLFARLARARIFHNDVHGRNLLVRIPEVVSACCALSVIDWDEATFGRPRESAAANDEVGDHMGDAAAFAGVMSAVAPTLHLAGLASVVSAHLGHGNRYPELARELHSRDPFFLNGLPAFHTLAETPFAFADMLCPTPPSPPLCV